MKKFVVFCLFFLAAVAVSGLDVETSLGYQTQYLFRGDRLVDTPVLTPAVGVVGKNFEFRAKSFYNLDKKENFRGEYSLTFKTDAKAFDMRVGFQHLDMLKVDNRDVNEFFVSAGWNRWGLAPKITLFWDMDNGSGKFIEMGISKALGRGKDATSIGVNFNYVINNDLLGKNRAGNQFSGFYNAEFMLKSTIDMGKHFKAHPFLAYSFPLSSDGKFAIEQLSIDKKENSFYGGVSFDILF